MPEYLAPGVYVEEVSFRSKSIEGVSTSTAGFIGATRFGPTSGEPELITSFNQFERIYGGIDPLNYSGSEMPNYMAHAVRAFFDNGGKRLYIARTYYSLADAEAAAPAGMNADGVASAPIPSAAAESALAAKAADDAAKAASSALNASFDAAQAALQAALHVIRSVLPSGVSVPAGLNLETETDANIIAAFNTTLTAAAQPLLTGAQETLITDAVTLRSDAIAERTDANTTRTTLDGAIAAGTADANAVAEGALNLTNAKLAAATEAGDADTARTALTPLATALNAPRAALVAAETALDASPADPVAAGNDVLTAGGNVLTPADALTTEVNDTTIPAIRDAAEAARLVERAAVKDAVGVFSARFPGAAGNLMVTVTARVAGQNVLSSSGGQPRLSQVRPNDLALVVRPGSNTLYLLQRAGSSWNFVNDGGTLALGSLNPAADKVFVISLTVEALAPGAFSQPMLWTNLTIAEGRSDSLSMMFAKDITNRSRELETPLVLELKGTALQLADGLIGGATGLTTLAQAKASGVSTHLTLTGGNDGVRPEPEQYIGTGGDDDSTKTGLKSFEDLEEISIVAAPGSSYDGAGAYNEEALAIANAVITHCEMMRYRVAVLDSPDDLSLSGVRAYRAILDTTRAALYYPWVKVLDPVSRQPMTVPPSGFIVGIYARNDNERGVHKAPANEVVRGAIGLETLLNKAQQDILNPIGINCVRYFENRGIRAWGARTLSSDPEWKYLNIRRYFVYLEHSIERSTQWAVFEPNGETLWANVRRAVEDFLYNEWKSDRLAGTKPSEAFFVRCDRSTMTQNDLDNGRMICLIGVAPLYPAEFVIFRIGQWTGDRRE